ncbi:hypothetical protein IJ182_06490 [bacterium]|nr:hypothetical protein [bacterium]
MTNKNDILLIKNPVSRSRKGKKNWKYFSDFDGIITKSRENAIDIVSSTNKKVIAAVGGDGTINQCVNGIMNTGGEKILSVLYSGTSPDFCKFHNIPINPNEAVKILKEGNIKEVDVCSLTTKDNKNYWFSSGSNIGLGVKVAGTSNKIRWLFGDFLGTLIALIYAISSSKPFNAKVKINNEEKELNNIWHLFVIKNNHIASGLKLNVNNTDDNGIIYVVSIKNDNIKNLIKNIVALYKGNINKENIVGFGNEVYIETNPNQYIEFDGDAYYSITTPITIKCHRKALKLIK